MSPTVLIHVLFSFTIWVKSLQNPKCCNHKVTCASIVLVDCFIIVSGDFSLWAVELEQCPLVIYQGMESLCKEGTRIILL